MKYNLTIAFTIASGARQTMQYVNQAAADVIKLVTQYLNDTTIKSVTFNGIELTAAQSKQIEAAQAGTVATQTQK